MKVIENFIQIISSKEANIKSVFYRRGILTKFICLIAVLIIVPIEVQAITIDGNVQGFGEGYSVGYDVTFDIEKGPSGVTGGKLFVEETTSYISVGLITPVTINDNTYGDTKASDWGTKDHFLIGGKAGKNLEGSDKWALKNLSVSVGNELLEMKLDYIDESGGIFNSRIERFKQGKTNLASGLTFETSLSYNYNVLGLTQFFGTKNDDEDGDLIDSPLSSVGDYNFTGVAQNWIPEIMYEFKLDKSAFSGTFNIKDFLNNLGTLHMSPNKMGGNKVYVKLGQQISDPIPNPEPATIALLGIGLVGLAGAEVRRRRKKKAVDKN